MKKLLFGTVVAIWGVSAFAQGQVNFSTFSPIKTICIVTNDILGFGWKAGDTIPALGNLPAGTPIRAAFYFGTTASGSDLNMLGSSAGFGTAAATYGYILSSTGGGTRTTSVPGGTAAFGQIRAWTGNYASYEAAMASYVSPGNVGYAGTTAIIPITPTSAPATPPQLALGSSFFLYPVPEPSVVALGLLGAAGLLFIRRRK